MRPTSTHSRCRRFGKADRSVIVLLMTAILVLGAGTAAAGSGLEDAMLEAKVRLALLTELGFDTLDVKVAVTDGDVALTGEVDKRETRELSKHVVATVNGVRSVNDDIVLKNSDDTTVAGAVEEVERETRDAVLETRVKLALLKEIGTDALGINVAASDGKVVLSGDAGADADTDRLEETVSSVEGVTDVVNRISTSP